MKYRCSKCNLAVIVLPNQEPIKACKCEATIIAEAQSIAFGNGGIKK